MCGVQVDTCVCMYLLYSLAASQISSHIVALLTIAPQRWARAPDFALVVLAQSCAARGELMPQTKHGPGVQAVAAAAVGNKSQAKQQSWAVRDHCLCQAAAVVARTQRVAGPMQYKWNLQSGFSQCRSHHTRPQSPSVMALYQA